MKNIALDDDIHAVLKAISIAEGRTLRVVLNRTLLRDEEFKRVYAINHLPQHSDNHPSQPSDHPPQHLDPERGEKHD
jgi:hypothetical protein